MCLFALKSRAWALDQSPGRANGDASGRPAKQIFALQLLLHHANSCFCSISSKIAAFAFLQKRQASLNSVKNVSGFEGCLRFAGQRVGLAVLRTMPEAMCLNQLLCSFQWQLV